nr:glycosyltransferase [Actinomycetota bacterium]
MSRALVVIPTFNERENLADTVARVRASVPEAAVLVVDDASPDGTGVLADELAAADDAVQVCHRTAKDGLGAAYLEAFAWALERGFDPIVQLDADGSHLPEELPRLLA